MVLLRDGRTLIGYLRSVDQFANLVLHRTIERIHVGKEYGDIPRGVLIVRGENVVLLGEIVCFVILSIICFKFIAISIQRNFSVRTKTKKKTCHCPKFHLMTFSMLKGENKS